MAIGAKKLTSRDLDARKTKDKIFETALRLFEEYGFETVSVDDIVQSAGASKGAFYTHFVSKDSILVEQFIKIDQAYKKVYKGIPLNTSASEQLHTFVKTLCAYCSRECGINLIKVVYMNQIGLRKHERLISLRENKQGSSFQFLDSIIKLGFESGEFKVDLSREKLLEYLERYTHGLIYDWCLMDGEKDLEEMGEEFYSIVIKWITRS